MSSYGIYKQNTDHTHKIPTSTILGYFVCSSYRQEQLYDIGNDLYRLMLDARLTYSCGYWKEAKTLDQAQEHKFDLICRKLNLQPGQKILDIGCGWGGFMKYAVEKYKGNLSWRTGIILAPITIRRLCAGLKIFLKIGKR